MFVGSSKDLRKGFIINSADRRSCGNEGYTNKQDRSNLSTISKKCAIISSSISSVDGIIDKVKNVRQSRQNDREMNAKTTIIQSWYRGIFYREKFRRERRKLYDNNISDITNLLSVCKARNIEFVTPIDASLKLFTLFFQKHIVINYSELDEINRILSLCEFIVFPSLIQFDPSKNIISNDRFLNELSKNMLDSIMHILKSFPSVDKKLSINKDRIKKSLLCLTALAGQQNENISLNSRFNLSRQNMQNSRNIVNEVRSVLTSFSQSFIDSNCNKISQSPYERLADQLILFLIFLIEADGSQDIKIYQFYCEIFTVPVFTLLLSDIVIRKLINWKYFINILKLCQYDNTLLPPTSSAIQSKHWLFGNIAYIGTYLIVDKANANHCSDEILMQYLLCSVYLFEHSNIPSVFQGGNAVVWFKHSSNLTACSVPIALSHQLLCYHNNELCTQLVLRVFQPLCESDIDRYGSTEDLLEISKSLQSTGIAISQSSLSAQHAENTWFTSKWGMKVANKFMKSITTGLGFSRQSSTDNIYINSDRRMHAIRDINIPMINTLCKLWSLIFSMATFSNIETKPWKNVMLISFSTPIVRCLWFGFLNICDNIFKSIKYSNSTHDNYFSKIDSIDGIFNDNRFTMLSTMLSFLCHILCTSDDSELYELARPLPLHQTVRLIRICKTILYRFVYLDPTILDLPVLDTYSEVDSSNVVTKLHRYAVLKSISSVLSDLYNRWARRPYFNPSLWQIEELDSTRIKQELRDRSPFSTSIYKYLPWSVDFYERMKIFREVLNKEKTIIQGTDDPHNRSKGTVVRVRRSMIVEDGILAIDKVGHAMKDRIVVRYINNFGEEEAGIDIGGLFKDFVSDLSLRIFDPSYGLFAITNKHELYPNPDVATIYPEDDIEKLFLFLGRVLGKALYENITLQPQFAHFFLSFMHGKYDYKNLINDLNTYDEEIYKNLMFLKNYSGDLNDLGLTFSVTESAYGGNREVNLISNGANIAVSDENKMRYINLVAKYYLYDRIKLQARAFFKGLYELIQPDLLTIFCAPELQILISGSTCGIIVDELKANTRYLGGYTPFDRNISWFWCAVQELNSDDLSKLIKFVTSCPRAPSLGFASLDPPFGIQRVECSDDSRLPTASTCFNILKLPTYSAKNILKEKLLVSIRSCAGFDLS